MAETARDQRSETEVPEGVEELAEITLEAEKLAVSAKSFGNDLKLFPRSPGLIELNQQIRQSGKITSPVLPLFPVSKEALLDTKVLFPDSWNDFIKEATRLSDIPLQKLNIAGFKLQQMSQQPLVEGQQASGTVSESLNSSSTIVLNSKTEKLLLTKNFFDLAINPGDPTTAADITRQVPVSGILPFETKSLSPERNQEPQKLSPDSRIPLPTSQETLGINIKKDLKDSTPSIYKPLDPILKAGIGEVLNPVVSTKEGRKRAAIAWALSNPTQNDSELFGIAQEGVIGSIVGGAFDSWLKKPGGKLKVGAVAVPSLIWGSSQESEKNDPVSSVRKIEKFLAGVGIGSLFKNPLKSKKGFAIATVLTMANDIFEDFEKKNGITDRPLKNVTSGFFDILKGVMADAILSRIMMNPYGLAALAAGTGIYYLHETFNEDKTRIRAPLPPDFNPELFKMETDDLREIEFHPGQGHIYKVIYDTEKLQDSEPDVSGHHSAPEKITPELIERKMQGSLSANAIARKQRAGVVGYFQRQRELMNENAHPTMPWLPSVPEVEQNRQQYKLSKETFFRPDFDGREGRARWFERETININRGYSMQGI